MPDPQPDYRPPTVEELASAVERKLKESLLRRLAGRKAVSSTWDVRGYRMHCWTNEILLTLAAAGLSHPVLAVMLPSPGTSDRETAKEASVLEFFFNYPRWVWIPLLTVFVGWLLLRVYVGVRKLTDRGPQILACDRELGVLESDLAEALENEKPIPRLVELVSKSKEIVDRYFKADLWPWPIGPENEGRWIENRAKELCDRHRGSWKP